MSTSMMTRTSRIVGIAVGLVVVALVLAGCGASGSDDDANASDLRGIVRTTPLEVGQVSLPEVGSGSGDRRRRADGRFAVKAAPGELLVVYFGFTSCPDVCPTTLADLRTAREEVGADAAELPLAMITVDPARDTPEKLSSYLSTFSDRYRALRTDDPTRAGHRPGRVRRGVLGHGRPRRGTGGDPHGHHLRGRRPGPRARRVDLRHPTRGHGPRPAHPAGRDRATGSTS